MKNNRIIGGKKKLLLLSFLVSNLTNGDPTGGATAGSCRWDLLSTTTGDAASSNRHGRYMFQNQRPIVAKH